MTLKTLCTCILIVFVTAAMQLTSPQAQAQNPTTAQPGANPAEPIKNLSFQNADIKTVLGFLADYGQVNIVTSPDVTGNVTFSLKKVTWHDALDILCKTYGLTAVEEAGYIRVTATKNYLDEVATMAKHNFVKEKLVELNTMVMKVDNAQARSTADAGN